MPLLAAHSECTGDFNKILGNRMRAFRQERKLTQNTVAQALGVSFQQIQKYERGTNRISAERFVALCHILGASPLVLLDWKTAPVSLKRLRRKI